MDSVLKNILLCGAGVLVVFLFSALILMQESRSEIEVAINAAESLGSQDAAKSARAGDFHLLASGHGFSGRYISIPAIDTSTYEACLEEYVPIRYNKRYPDLALPVPAHEHIRELIDEPTSTGVYAQAFNETMLSLLPDEIFDCRIPEPQ